MGHRGPGPGTATRRRFRAPNGNGWRRSCAPEGGYRRRRGDRALYPRWHGAALERGRGLLRVGRQRSRTGARARRPRAPLGFGPGARPGSDAVRRHRWSSCPGTRGPDQAFWRLCRGRRPELRGQAGRRLWVSGTQRQRKEHDHTHDPWPRQAHIRRGQDIRPSRHLAGGTGQDGRLRGDAGFLRVPLGTRQPEAPGGGGSAGGQEPTFAGGTADGKALGPGQGQGEDLFPGHEAASRHSRGPAQGTGVSRPRRAHERTGSRGHARRQGTRQATLRRGPDDLPLHPPAGGGRATLQPGRRREPRPPPGRGRPGGDRAAGQGPHRIPPGGRRPGENAYGPAGQRGRGASERAPRGTRRVQARRGGPVRDGSRRGGACGPDPGRRGRRGAGAGAGPSQPGGVVLAANGGRLMVRWELFKLIRQRRTFLGLGAAAIVPILFLVAVRITREGPPPGEAPFATQLLSNGLVIPLITLSFGSVVLLPLLTVLVAGDAIAGEVSAGTLKTVLGRSVGRSGLFWSKTVAVELYTLIRV